MACLYECKQRNAWQLGLKWLFELINDEIRHKKIRQLYSFSYMEFIKLNAEFDIYASGSSVETTQEVVALRAHVQDLLTGHATLTSQLHEIRHHWGMRFVNFLSRTKLF